MMWWELMWNFRFIFSLSQFYFYLSFQFIFSFSTICFATYHWLCRNQVAPIAPCRVRVGSHTTMVSDLVWSASTFPVCKMLTLIHQLLSVEYRNHLLIFALALYQLLRSELWRKLEEMDEYFVFREIWEYIMCVSETSLK